MNKKIITIAGIVFALIFVVLLAVMMGTITTKANSANSKLVDTLEMTDNTSLSIYDGTTVKGESVTNAIKNVKQIGGSYKLKIFVVTGDGAKNTYGYTSDTPVTETPNSPSDSGYINSSSNFTSNLATNENDVVTAIVFIQDGSGYKFNANGEGDDIDDWIKR